MRNILKMNMVFSLIISRKENGYLNIYDVNEIVNYGTRFEITHQNKTHFDPRFFANEISEQAFALYNEYDFLLDLKSENTTSKIGALHLFAKLTAYTVRNAMKKEKVTKSCNSTVTKGFNMHHKAIFNC